MRYHVNFAIDFKKNKYKGKFIAIEGMDGSGKTTQAKKVVEELIKRGYKAKYTKEPTDGSIGKFIKKDILSGKVKVAPVSIQYLIAADRATHQLDYYLTSMSLLSMYNQFINTDITFFLEISLETALKRIGKSAKHNEIYDDKKRLKKVKKAYDLMIKKFPKEFTIVNGEKSKEKVTNDILEAIKEIKK